MRDPISISRMRVRLRHSPLLWDTAEPRHTAPTLSQHHARTRCVRRQAQHPGDVAPVGDAVSELRIHHGPGYRVYFTHRGKEIILLLAGGDKSTQAKDIKTALRLAKNL